MKKIFYVLSFILIFASCNTEEKIIESEEKMGPPVMVPVCHYDPVTDTWSTINIPEAAKAAHLAHGDFDGDCDDRLTYVPDDAFEEMLIRQGRDDVLDDYVLTENIQNIEKYTIPLYAFYDPDRGDVVIEDLTGIEGFKSLKEFNCFATNITKLDLTNNLELTRIYMEANRVSPSSQINTLDISNNIKLDYFYISGYNNFTSLDLTNNPLLTKVFVNLNSQLTKLDLKNGANNIITIQDFTDNINLNCIQVDDAAYALANWLNKDAGASYSDNCGY